MPSIEEKLISELQEKFPGVPVYFQPPENLTLRFPCLVLSLTGDKRQFADDKLYARFKHFTITVVDKDPLSKIPDEVAKLKYCRMSTRFVSANMNHTRFEIFR